MRERYMGNQTNDMSGFDTSSIVTQALQMNSSAYHTALQYSVADDLEIPSRKTSPKTSIKKKYSSNSSLSIKRWGISFCFYENRQMGMS